MQLPLSEARELARVGMDALRRGEGRLARASFEKIVAAGMDDASACVALGMACRALGDGPAALAAVDRALAREARSIRALVLKADILADLGDARAASAFYLEVVKAADVPGAVPPDLQGDVARAREMCDKSARSIEEGIRERLEGTGLARGAAAGRFLQSLDILFGHKRPYYQQPRYYNFPGLPQTQFYDRAMFPWLDSVEAATVDIQTELAAILQDGTSFRPYLESDPRRPRKLQDGMLDNPDWGAFYLWKNGEAVPENAARCPKTLAALADAPIARMANRSPSILFSLLRPGARIPAHCGLVNTRLICHLPLLVPGPCSFRVGNEVRDWEEGKAWVFDDSIEHEAWNRSDKTRVILLFEIWRPELTTEERALVTAMFEAIDAGTGVRPAWEI